MVPLAHCSMEDTHSASCKLDILGHLVGDPLGFRPMHLPACIARTTVRVVWHVRSCAWWTMLCGVRERPHKSAHSRPHLTSVWLTGQRPWRRVHMRPLSCSRTRPRILFCRWNSILQLGNLEPRLQIPNAKYGDPISQSSSLLPPYLCKGEGALSKIRRFKVCVSSVYRSSCSKQAGMRVEHYPTCVLGTLVHDEWSALLRYGETQQKSTRHVAPPPRPVAAWGIAWDLNMAACHA